MTNKQNTLQSQGNESMFDSIKHTDSDNNEYWLARELMPLLEYTEWRNFNKVIKKAKTASNKIYTQNDIHFVEVNKMYKIAKGTRNQASVPQKDYKLTRRACYLIAQNGDSRKEAIALAQNYFASQTRKQELFEIKEKDLKRILARKKLTDSEKKFAGVMSKREVDSSEIAEVKSAGDEALFGKRTSLVKQQLGIKKYKPLADHLPTISIKAKDLATEMSTFQTEQKNLIGKKSIKTEHVSNNTAVRNMLTEKGIYPERLPSEEDVKKLEKKYTKEEITLAADQNLDPASIAIDIRSVHQKETVAQIIELIEKNPGEDSIKIYYGRPLKYIERNLNITPQVIAGLKNYLVSLD